MKSSYAVSLKPYYLFRFFCQRQGARFAFRFNRFDQGGGPGLKQAFRPEFLNRIDDIIVFNSLSLEHLAEIVDILLPDLKDEVIDVNIVQRMTDSGRL